MKMNNRFRVNLHPAFYFALETSTSQNENTTEKQSQYEVLGDSRSGVLELQRDALEGEAAVQVDTEDLSREFSGGLSENYLLNDRERFKKRCAEKLGDKSLQDKWILEINNGYGHLLSALKENNYFDRKDEATETARIKSLYIKEVKKQYKDKVWSAGDKKFNAVKATLFSRESEDYPANKIYKELTGAVSIFTAERTYLRGQRTEILEDVSDGEEENMSDRRNRNFLSKDLPQYLWDIKKAPHNVNILFLKIKVNKPSNKDIKAISNFIKVSSRLNVPQGQDAAVALIKAFKTNRLGANSGIDAYKKYLTELGISAKKEKYWDDIVKVGNFYFRTQSENNAAEDQHATYLSILRIIEDEGGIKNAVEKYKDLVDKSKADKKQERKDGGYENGETLKRENQALFGLAQKLGIEDFTNATRLQRKSPDYFAKFKDSPEKVLANINNDNVLSALDTVTRGSKSGQQFIEAFRQVSAAIGDKTEKDEKTGETKTIKGSDVVLNKLLDRAKLKNKALSLGLDESKFTIEEIKNGNKELILLLQNIISNPREDLLTLLGDKTRVEYDKDFLEKTRQQAEAYAKEMAGKVKLDELRNVGLTNLPQPEELQSGLAATLYSEYSKGIGLGSNISFDEWVKGLSMNTGFQVRDDKSVVIGIGLSYKQNVNLGKGWSTTPMFSAGGFIPLGYGKPELGGSLGFSNEIAKKWITKNGVAQKIGFDAGVTVMNTGTVILSAGIKWYRDKLAGINTAEQQKRNEMNDLMKTMLDEYFQKVSSETGIKTPSLDLEDPKCMEIMKRVVRSNAEKQGVPADKLNSVVDATINLLLPYQGAQLMDSGMKDIIAAGVADQYAMAWAENRKAHISDSAYLSGANLGVFWVAGSPLVGIYAGLRGTKHNLDGYADRWGREYSLDHQYAGGRNDELITRFNQEAGFEGNDVLSISEIEGKKYVKIPKDLKYRVHVNEKLKGNMKQDAQGNVLLHVQTPMASKILNGSATQGSEIIIGGRKGENFSMLDRVGNDWFTDKDLNKTEILNLGEGIRTYSAEVINNALAELKAKIPGDDLQKFEISEEKMAELINQANDINNQNPPHRVIFNIFKNSNGELDISIVASIKEGRGLDMEYKATLDMIDSKAKEVANYVYAEALKVKNPNALHAVKHKPWPEYAEFNNAMLDKDYNVAREKIKPIFEKLDQQIRGANFSAVLDKLNGITDINALGQAMMSINNIFARSKKVRGGGESYEFKGRDRRGREVPISMGTIIKEREGQIKGTIERKISDQNVRNGYVSLINASAKYREQHPDLFRKTSDKAKQLDNTVGFNLGDQSNPENPLFNPEIYSSVVDLQALESLGFVAEQRNALHKRAMELFANNDALIAPILKVLGLEGGQVSVGNFENGKLILDISKDNVKKQITLKADLNFGYFTQCVNHTVILSNISAIGPEGTSVQFNSGVWEGGTYREGNKTSIVSTTEVELGGSVTAGRENPNQGSMPGDGIVGPKGDPDYDPNLDF